MTIHYLDLGDVGNRFIKKRDLIYQIDNQVYSLEKEVDGLLKDVQNICKCDDISQFLSNLETIYNSIIDANASLILVDNQSEIISIDDKKDIAKIRQKIEMMDKICGHLSNKFAFVTYREQYEYIKKSNRELFELTKYLNKLTLILMFLTLALLWESYTTFPEKEIADHIGIRSDILILLIIGILIVAYYYYYKNNMNGSGHQEIQRPDPP